MFDLPIGKLVSAYTRLATLGQYIGSLQPTMHLGLAEREYVDLLQLTRDFSAASEAVGLTTTSVPARDLILELERNPLEPDGLHHYRGSDQARVKGYIDRIVHCFQAEATLKVALMLPHGKEKYFSPENPLFGDEVHEKFCSARYDIAEAGKCLAVGRSTATVFHLMRVLEVALRSVYKCLGIEVELVGNARNWGIVLNRIRDERLTRERAGWPEGDFFQSVYARLDAIKDAWRNRTMHVESVYTEEEATTLFDNTRTFMQKLSARMDEHGLPLA